MTFAIDAGEALTVRVIQSANNGATKWANTLEYVAATEIDEDIAATIANTIAGAFQSILINQFKIEKVVVSTYVEDGKPYNPDTFISFPFNLIGERGRFSETPVDLSVCLRLDKRASSGRSGRMLLRGVLHEGMLTTVGGRFNFQFPSSLDGIDFGEGLNEVQSLVDLGTAQLALVSNSYMRAVSAITVAGVTIKKLNNKYFNRS